MLPDFSGAGGGGGGGKSGGALSSADGFGTGGAGGFTLGLVEEILCIEQEIGRDPPFWDCVAEVCVTYLQSLMASVGEF